MVDLDTTYLLDKWHYPSGPGAAQLTDDSDNIRTILENDLQPARKPGTYKEKSRERIWHYMEYFGTAGNGPGFLHCIEPSAARMNFRWPDAPTEAWKEEVRQRQSLAELMPREMILNGVSRLEWPRHEIRHRIDWLIEHSLIYVDACGTTKLYFDPVNREFWEYLPLDDAAEALEGTRYPLATDPTPVLLFNVETATARRKYRLPADT